MLALDPYVEPQQPVWRTTLLGDLESVTPPSGLAVTRAETKLHCKIDADQTADDNLIDALIDAATRYCEQSIQGHRQLLTATYDLPVIAWWEGPLKLPRPPLASVTSVKYYATDGTLTTLSSGNYLVRTPFRQPGSVERAPLIVWPALQCDRRLPVVIRFVCGYGAASAVPRTIRQAILMLVGFWYMQREAAAAGTVSKEVDFAVEALLSRESYGSYT